jgi:hypothetical protein
MKLQKSKTWNPIRTAWRVVGNDLHGSWCYSRLNAIWQWLTYRKPTELDKYRYWLEHENLRLERELATECAINKRNCDDWAHDHTHLQNLCRKAGYDEHAVEGDSYGIRSITQLADMLMAKIALPNSV